MSISFFYGNIYNENKQKIYLEHLKKIETAGKLQTVFPFLQSLLKETAEILNHSFAAK